MIEDLLLAVALGASLLALVLHARRRRAPRRPAVAPPPARRPDAEPARPEPPKELMTAWVQFLRDDVARSVNALNNRLGAIGALAMEADGATPSAPLAHALEQIRLEVSRAANITGGLLKRVRGAAPEGSLPAYRRLSGVAVRPAHLLVVEDDESNRNVIRKLLGHFGHRVTTVQSGLQAVAVLQREPVDCIVCDLQMPTMNGTTLFEQVEELLPHLASRFVFVTGDHTRPESRAFLESCGQPVVAKPYEVDELLGAVADVLAAGSRAHPAAQLAGVAGG